MAKLAELMPFLEGHPQALMAAQRGIADRAAEMDRNFRAAQGSATGFFAGIEQGMVAMDKATSAFELGQAMVNGLSNSFVNAAMEGEINFQKIAASFAQMLA